VIRVFGGAEDGVGVGEDQAHESELREAARGEQRGRATKRVPERRAEGGVGRHLALEGEVVAQVEADAEQTGDDRPHRDQPKSADAALRGAQGYGHRSYVRTVGETVGGGDGWSAESRGSESTRGQWRTEAGVVHVRSGMGGWEPYARYYVEGAQLMLTFDNGQREVWSR
jgi:hypothetical protein